MVLCLQGFVVEHPRSDPEKFCHPNPGGGLTPAKSFVPDPGRGKKFQPRPRPGSYLGTRQCWPSRLLLAVFFLSFDFFFKKKIPLVSLMFFGQLFLLAFCWPILAVFFFFSQYWRVPSLTPANFCDPAPGRGLTPAGFFDPDPGRG